MRHLPHHPHRTRFLALALATAALGGCGLRERTRADDGTGDLLTFDLRHDGLDRTYHVYEPPGLPDRAVPVVVVLHGGFGDGPGALEQGRWRDAADEHGFLVVAPDGYRRSWNAGTTCCGPALRDDVDDVGFVLAVLDALGERWDVDEQRVYATGISNGGMLSYRLACNASDRFAAVAPVAGTLLADCSPSQPVSLLHIHGTDDRNVLIEGGVGERRLQRDKTTPYPPISDGIQLFVQADDTEPEPTTDVDGDVTTQTWSGGRDGTTVELILIEGGGHSWPGGERMSRILDPPSDALDATATIWQFFDAHGRASAS